MLDPTPKPVPLGFRWQTCVDCEIVFLRRVNPRYPRRRCLTCHNIKIATSGRPGWKPVEEVVEVGAPSD